jgi:hypothetical protein
VSNFQMKGLRAKEREEPSHASVVQQVEGFLKEPAEIEFDKMFDPQERSLRRSTVSQWGTKV